ADNRALAAFPILIVSSGIAVIGFLAFRRRSRVRIVATPYGAIGGWPAPPWSFPSAGPSPYAPPDPNLWPPGVPLPPPPPPAPPLPPPPARPESGVP
ncbi:MAG: hypothetical protein ACRDWB_04650, partial [Acidimicrobiales bacterium]